MSSGDKNFDRVRQEAADQGMPDLGLSPMAQSMAEINEAFQSFVVSGFTESQATYLCGALLTGNPGYPPK